MAAEPQAHAATATARGGTGVVIRRELGAYFDSAIAYVFAAVFLLLAHGIFMNGFFLGGALDLDAYFRVLPFLLVLFVPAITMRAWAEERAQGTLELALTMPLRTGQLVLGKFVAAFVFLNLVLSGSLVLVIMLLALGEPDLGTIVAQSLGAVLLGALFLAIGLCASVGTHDQVIAFVVAAFGCGSLVLLGMPEVVEVVDGLWPDWQVGSWLAETVSVLPCYERCTHGLLALGDVAWFVAATSLFLWLNHRALAPHRR
jgi:ABC-2 type transport system permease protein